MAEYEAIETYYNGFHFRSRLEARWAIFFDHLGIEYLYEPQGFVLGEEKICYLPDFYLPEIKTWVEVKGVLSDNDEKKIDYFVEEYLSDHKEERIIILGDIPKLNEIDILPDKCKLEKYAPFSTSFDCHYLPCITACGKFGFEFATSSSLLLCFSFLL